MSRSATSQTLDVTAFDSAFTSGKTRYMQDKDQAVANKTHFLTTVLDAAGQATGQHVNCNVKHVLRGKDPEGANRLLQALAEAAHSSRQGGVAAVKVRILAKAVSQVRAVRYCVSFCRPRVLVCVLVCTGEQSQMYDLAKPHCCGQCWRTSTAALQDLKIADAPPADSFGARPASRRASKPTLQSMPVPLDDAPQARDIAPVPQHGPEVLTLDEAPLPGAPSMQRQTGSSADGQRPASAGTSLQPQRSHDRAAAAPAGALSQLASRSEAAQRPASRGHAPGHTPRRSDTAVVPAGGAERTSFAQVPQPAASHGPSAGLPSASLTPPARPMTAKAAPPKAPELDTTALTTRRGRMRPPEMAETERRGSAGVHIYRDHDNDADDDVDIVQERYVTAQAPQEAHGVLTRDMFKAKEAAEQLLPAHSRASAEQDAAEIQGGITLKRTHRRDRQSAAQRIDFGQLQASVEAIVQGVAPLAQAMEHLQVSIAKCRWQVVCAA